jgi:hypothetical protein
MGHWVDLYVMIFPAFEHPAVIGLVDAAIVIGFASLFLQSFANGLRKSALVPQNDIWLRACGKNRGKRPIHSPGPAT